MIAGDFKGKLSYTSPKQSGRFGGKVDARSDVYSLRVRLAEAAPMPMGQTFYKDVLQGLRDSQKRAAGFRRTCPWICRRRFCQCRGPVPNTVRNPPELMSPAPQAATQPPRELKSDPDVGGGMVHLEPSRLMRTLYPASARLVRLCPFVHALGGGSGCGQYETYDGNALTVVSRDKCLCASARRGIRQICAS
jgi:hypothetical protein